jgi:hypothetical protein
MQAASQRQDLMNISFSSALVSLSAWQSGHSLKCRQGCNLRSSVSQNSLQLQVRENSVKAALYIKKKSMALITQNFRSNVGFRPGLNK